MSILRTASSTPELSSEVESVDVPPDCCCCSCCVPLRRGVKGRTSGLKVAALERAAAAAELPPAALGSRAAVELLPVATGSRATAVRRTPGAAGKEVEVCPCCSSSSSIWLTGTPASGLPVSSPAFPESSAAPRALRSNGTPASLESCWRDEATAERVEGAYRESSITAAAAVRSKLSACGCVARKSLGSGGA
jgi:hypothetical protein